MRTYRHDERGWLAYQGFLPPQMRLGDSWVPDETTWAWRGLDVHLDRFPAADAPLSVVVLHGGGGYGRILSSLGRIVRELGYEAVMPDLPGYGLTAVPARRFTYGTWVALVADLVRAESSRTGRPVVVLGASMGGLLGWHAAGVAPAGTVAGVAATTLIDAREPAVREAVSRWPGTAAMVRFGRALDPLRVPMPLVGKVDGIANDPALARVFLADPLGGGNRVPVRFLRSWMLYEPAVEPEDWDRGPVLLAHPGADRWTPTALSLAFFDRLPESKRFAELPGCGHFPIEEPGATVLRRELERFLAAAHG
jgi:alpha-beta hydrolase superfamily lysophospholipase